VTEFHNLKGETADVLTTYTMDVLDKYKLLNEIIAICGDNCNTNFGGAARKGTDNVFAKLTTSDLKINIRGIQCAAHILYNALRTSADILPVGVEAIKKTSALDGDEWSASRPDAPYPRYPLDRRLDGPQSQSGRRG
jgi:hypothetical protein